MEIPVSRGEFYASMPLPLDHFRLLSLQPGLRHKPIVCSLEVASLHASDIKAYDALSYVWGQSNHGEGIRLECKLAQADPVETCISVQVGITANLYNALLELRSSHDPRILWIDALCINQHSNEERNHQIRHMTTIYSRARRTMIWLGQCDAEETLRVLINLGQGHYDETTRFDDYGRRAHEAALSRIFQRDWFYRIWTKQELAVSSPDTMVMLGSESINWGTFLDWVMRVQTLWYGNSRSKARQHEASRSRSVQQTEIEQIISFNTIRSQHANGEAMPLLQLLYLTKDAQASDPRDKIYALLGMSTAPTLKDFPPDYNLDVREVCRLTALQLIATEKNLRPLLQWSERTMDLPSWMPDYTSSSSDFVAVPLVDPLLPSPYQACGLSCPVTRCGEMKDQFIITGIVFDQVSRVETKQWWEIAAQPATTQEQSTQDPHDIRNHLDNSGPLWRTLVAGDPHRSGERSSLGNNAHVEWAKHLFSKRSANISQDELKLIDSCVAVMKARCVFYTSAGFVGIGPCGMKPFSARVEEGDIVAVLYGGETPFVLRPRGACYELIGECYVSGIMQGEFMYLFETYDGWPGCPVEKEFELR